MFGWVNGKSFKQWQGEVLAWGPLNVCLGPNPEWEATLSSAKPNVALYEREVDEEIQETYLVFSKIVGFLRVDDQQELVDLLIESHLAEPFLKYSDQDLDE